MPLVSKTFGDIITFTRASTGSYFDATGTLQSAAINSPRFDYDPSTLAPQGFLIEEARTNSIRNNTMQGAVAGTPGTLPTNWGVFTVLTGLTREVVGTGTENGITYIDFRVSGTPSGAGTYLLFPEASTGVAALNGQTWTNSAYFKLQAGTLTGVTAVRLYFEEKNSGGAYLAEQNSTIANPTSAALNTQRASATRTLNQATTAFLLPGFSLLLTGVAIDITLRIGLPQLELGAFATSVIPTTTTALTRSADVASVNTLSPWFNATEGTLYTEFAVTQPASGGNQFIGRFSDNTYNNAIANNITAAGFGQISVITAGVATSAGAAVGISANTITKLAGAYATNDLAVCKDAGTVATTTTSNIPTGLTRVDLGSDHLGLNRVKAGYLRRVTFYPRRLSNAELQTITT